MLPTSQAPVASCAICLEQTDSSSVMSSICSPTCPASICIPCLELYILQRQQNLPQGVVAPLPCPACLVPVNLLQWTAKCPPLARSIETFSEYLRAACDVVCPSCHVNTNILPAISSLNPSSSINLPIHFKANLMDLVHLCRQFCRHRASPSQVWHFLIESFPVTLQMPLLYQLLRNIHDDERRCVLLFRALKDFPVVNLPCCNARLCFTCKTEASLDHKCIDDSTSVITRCPNCSVGLTKGDGCDSMRCFCGTTFSWSQQVVVAKLKQLSPRHRLILNRRLSRVLWQMRFGRRVLPQLSIYSNVQRMSMPFRRQFIAICDLLLESGATDQWTKLLKAALKANELRDALPSKVVLLGSCKQLAK
ncbi:hypothetical protein Ae201684P_011295 [Aphanomyces euteiches]|uniref:RING-type domain-containing protein n=1 Tax=Aphanomyces euteiches TaxID=100861 RepID=A0A6G0XY15_9STRA|nr:hypothetical protein Ae201684_000387 [Aphanomyces euteiches]KAH9091751.1 hypothetical protein Ae201684P_011295 [Aphanomyces euteiches]